MTNIDPSFEKAKLLLEQKIAKLQEADNERDYEAAHAYEDEVAQFALQVIATEAKTVEQAKTLANMVLEDLDHDNPRWYG